MSNKIEINGVSYVPESEVPSGTPIETDHIIVIAQRGWIFIGKRNKEVTDKIQLLDAKVVRSWTNGRGIGGLADPKHKDAYTLDEVGQIEFANEGVIATIAVRW